MASRILVVCTGNVCRSPAAEFLLRAALPDSVSVSSRGTHALPGQPFSTEMAALLKARRGLEVEHRGAVPLTAADVREAGLVLGMTREHRAFAVRLHPAAVRHAFTLTEFARLLGAGDDDLPLRADADHLLDLTVRRAQRGRRPVPAELDDVVDPIGQSHAVYARVFEQIDAAVQRIASVIASAG